MGCLPRPLPVIAAADAFAGLASRAAATLALCIGLHGAAIAAPADDIAALQRAVASMKADYDHRIAALEDELRRTRAQLQKASATPVDAAAAPSMPSAGTAAASAMGAPAAAVHAGAGAPANADAVAPAAAPPTLVAAPSAAASPEAASPAAGGGADNASAFNPSISLILSGLYVHTSREPADARITGFALPPGAPVGLGSRGFSLDESELAMAANIDPWLAGNINLSVTGDNRISPEEAFVTTTALPDGLVLRAGRFFSDVGYLNSQHSHTWDFADNPLAYQAMLGTQYSDDGLQLHWLAPTDQYLELGLEVGRGHSFPGDDSSRNAAGMTSIALHTGGDVGDSNSWRAGLSFLQASASGQALSDLDAQRLPATALFSGRTRVWIADGVWKWAPEGNATRHYVKLQGEFLQSRRDGNLAPEAGGMLPAAYRVIQSGGYLQGVWQFEPRWRLGARTEWLDPGHAPDGADGGGLFASSGYHPTKNSLMVDFNESEFARIRLQLARDRSREGAPDNQVILQYQTSLGAHGAHQY